MNCRVERQERLSTTFLEDPNGKCPLHRNNYVERFPIYTIDADDPDDVAARDAIADHVDTMLGLHAQRADATTDAERDGLQQRIEEIDGQIDQRVCELYGLGAEEIEVVEEEVTL